MLTGSYKNMHGNLHQYTVEASTSSELISKPNALELISVSHGQIELKWAYPGYKQYDTIIERKAGMIKIVNGRLYIVHRQVLSIILIKDLYPSKILLQNKGSNGSQYIFRLLSINTWKNNLYIPESSAESSRLCCFFNKNILIVGI